MNLQKDIEVGSLRFLGNKLSSLSPQKTVIAGKSIRGICMALDYKCFQYRNHRLKNIFIASGNTGILYIYVNPKYRNYRKIFGEFFNVPIGFHVDHVLGRRIAEHYKYNYVALCMIPGNVNIKHGGFEKLSYQKGRIHTLIDVCYCDNRIYNKILSRNPRARCSETDLSDGFHHTNLVSYGLTLKQKGLWNMAFGIGSIRLNASEGKSLKQFEFQV